MRVKILTSLEKLQKLVGQPASNAAGLIMFIFSPSGFILEEVKPFFPLLFTFFDVAKLLKTSYCISSKKRRHAVDTSQKKTTNRQTDRQTDRQTHTHTHTDRIALLYI